MRRSPGPMALCVMVLWGAVAAADLPDDPAATADDRAMRVSLFLPPELTAADIDQDAPAVYRLPPVEPPVGGLSEADMGLGVGSGIGIGDASLNDKSSSHNDDTRLVEDQPTDELPTVRDSVPPRQPQPAQPPWVNWDVLVPSVAEPVPEHLDMDAGAPVAREDSYAHHDTDRTNAADNHLSDADAGGGPVVEPAVEAGVLPYTPTTVELTTQLLPTVQHACGLAQRGATFAAQAEFIQVLRRIAQALDAQGDTDEHARALAAGLRALDEADDFAPRGTQLEAELDVAMMASSHRTPVLAGGTAGVSPREAVALYLSYAQQQLGRAVASQQTGSMALHAMGRLYSRLAQGGDGDIRHVRKAMTMYLAALEACPQNHLAANELGVLLAHNGHFAEAETMFRRAVSLSPTATGYHNLAVVQQKLGRPQQAIANQQQADRLAAWERANGDVSRRKGIQWVPPDVLARGGQETWTSTEAVAGVREAQPAATTAAPPAALGTPAFAPPPLASDDAFSPTTAVRVAGPNPAQIQNRPW